MNNRNTEQQLRYLEEVCTCLHRAGFETQPLEDSQLPVYWNGVPLCRITGKDSVFYRREDVGTPQTEEALRQAEDIAARTREYMLATVVQAGRGAVSHGFFAGHHPRSWLDGV